MPVKWVGEFGRYTFVCGGCGAVSPLRGMVTANGEACSECTRIGDTRPRDAMGNVVKVSEDVIGKFSYAIDGPITSQRQYAEVLKRKGLAQK